MENRDCRTALAVRAGCSFIMCLWGFCFENSCSIKYLTDERRDFSYYTCLFSLFYKLFDVLA